MTNALSPNRLGERVIYPRLEGITKQCIVGENEILFQVKYEAVKLHGLEVVGSSLGDNVDVFILKPNQEVIEKLCSNWNLPKDYYLRPNYYDNNLLKGMYLKIVYRSIDVKNIGANFLVYEVR